MTITRFRGPVLLLAGSALLTACAAVPELGELPQTRPAAGMDAAQALAPSAGAWPATDWWRGYDDPQLEGLIAEAIAGSPDLAAAAARLRKAEGLTQQAGAPLLPTIDASANAGYVQQSKNMGVPPQFVPDGWKQTARLGVGLSFDPDLWGRNRAALAAARSDAEAARYGIAEARLALTTAIAATYADLARLHAQKDLQAAALAIRLDTSRLVGDRVATGIGTRAELAQAQARVPAARADLAATDEAIALTRNALAALAGAGPDRALRIERPSAKLIRPRGLPDGAAIDLVGRRSDIAAARASVEAAASRIGIARAAFYPNISISALVGFQSLGFGNLLEGGSRFGNAGPAISLPLFHGGAISGQYRGARATYDEAVAHYDAAVVEALREVADTTASRRMLDVRLGESRAALDRAEDGYRLARQRYEGGLSTYLDVLTAEENLLGSRHAVADLEARGFTLDVAMVRALGGGFAAASERVPA